MCDLNALSSLERSDYMLCTNSAWLHYKDKKQNDGIFVEQMSKPQKKCIRDIDIESKFFNENSRSTKEVTCSPLLSVRGGSAYNCEPIKPCPAEWSQYKIKDFLLIPCPKNTYKNYQIFTDTMQCSKSHQMLNNWTKRKELTGFEDITR
jgi:hypothetical protein